MSLKLIFSALKKLVIGTALSCLFITAPSFANDARKKLDQDCSKCHGDQVYQRTNHKMQSLPQLRKQVNKCMTPGNASWFEDETEEVVQFLNNTFYNF